MLEVARRCHLSNSVTALLHASSTAEVPWQPPRNGDPVEGPVCTCVHKKNWIKNNKCVYKVRVLNTNNVRVECMRVCLTTMCVLTYLKKCV